MKTVISVIIPTYNRAHLISETLDSIISQTYTNWECIIVDDGSTDNSFEVIKKYIATDTRFQLFARPTSRSKGANTCRNFGFEKSNGEFILWLDSDDLLKENALKTFVNSFNENTDVVVAKLEITNLLTNIKIRENNIDSEFIIQDYVLGKIAYYVSGPLWKTTFLKKQLELFDENISNLDDWDFNLRMLYANPTIKFLNEPLILYRVNENSLSHEIMKLNKTEIMSELYAREKHVKLLKVNKLLNSKDLNVFIKNRCRYFLREALITNNKNKYFYLNLLIKKQLSLFRFVDIIKTIVVSIFYIVFKKGYKFL